MRCFCYHDDQNFEQSPAGYFIIEVKQLLSSHLQGEHRRLSKSKGNYKTQKSFLFQSYKKEKTRKRSAQVSLHWYAHSHPQSRPRVQEKRRALGMRMPVPLHTSSQTQEEFFWRSLRETKWNKRGADICSLWSHFICFSHFNTTVSVGAPL